MQENRKWNSLAVTSLVLGIFSVFAFQLVFIPIAAIVTGYLAIQRFDPATQRGRRLAIAGVVLGALYTLAALTRLF